jgi:GWxTD domain-containing protein
MTYKLPTDTYTLSLSLIDSSANYGVSSSKKFFVYNPSVEYVDTFKTQSSNIVAGMFGVMSEEELDDFFAKSRYIASVPEIEQYETLTTENAKREFLTNFWKARDEDPSDDMNLYLKNYLRKIKESNITYKALSKEGWKTDRGRVYLVYGQPSEVDRYPNQTQSRPHEIWYYHEIEGGVEFVFGDLTGFSDYTLLHSTKRGELQDPGWERRIVVR